jgi:hypothetical protein
MEIFPTTIIFFFESSEFINMSRFIRIHSETNLLFFQISYAFCVYCLLVYCLSISERIRGFALVKIVLGFRIFTKLIDFCLKIMSDWKYQQNAWTKNLLRKSFIFSTTLFEKKGLNKLWIWTNDQNFQKQNLIKFFLKINNNSHFKDEYADFTIRIQKKS